MLKYFHKWFVFRWDVFNWFFNDKKVKTHFPRIHGKIIFMKRQFLNFLQIYWHSASGVMDSVESRTVVLLTVDTRWVKLRMSLTPLSLTSTSWSFKQYCGAATFWVTPSPDVRGPGVDSAKLGRLRLQAKKGQLWLHALFVILAVLWSRSWSWSWSRWSQNYVEELEPEPELEP